MTYDCFTFFNELELLDIRLHELNEVVDRFVLVEANKTHSGKPKPLHYQENKDRFKNFHHKIIHVIVEDFPISDDAWVLENFQRNGIARGLTQCAREDWILISDIDEIPRAATVRQVVQEHPFPSGFRVDGLLRPVIRLFSGWKITRGRLRRNHPLIFKFEQNTYRHFLNCVIVNPPSLACWHGTRMFFFADFSSAQEIRHSGRKIVKNGGWHFTSMGGTQRIIEKITAFAHQELNNSEFLNTDRISKVLTQGKSIFDPAEEIKVVKLDDSFPRYILENAQAFSSWVKPA